MENSNPSRIYAWLASVKNRKGLLLATALGAVGLFVAWQWFGTSAVLRLLYVVPCAAMTVICMRGHGESGNTPGAPNGGGSVSDINRGIPQ